jgi:F-type H+-transporting ATPase subunit b
MVLFVARSALPASTAEDPSGAAHTATDDHGGAAAGGTPSPLRVDPDLAIWTAVVFIVLLVVLAKFAWNPIVEALQQREQNIADNIAAAAEKNEEAKGLLAEHQAKLAGAADEVRELLEEARRDAEQTKGQIVAEARAAAQAEHERGMRDLELATDSALKQLAETSANLAVDLAGKVVQETITPEHQARVVREALAKLASTEPSAN